MRILASRTLPILVVTALITVPAPLDAQAPSCAATDAPGVLGLAGDLAQLPVDRIADLLALEPGVVSLNQGDLSVRGAGSDAVATYLDGVPVTPGHRGASALLGGSYFGETGTGIGVGTNGFDRVDLHRSLGPAELGGSRGAAIAVVTRCAPDSAATRGSALTAGWASDALFGKEYGLGFNRLSLSGEHRAGRLTFGGAAVLEGLSSERLGLEQNQSPVYALRGADTTVTFDPGGGPVSVEVARFAPSDGIRIPSSATSDYAVQAHLGYQFGPGQQVRLSGFASQRQARVFDYPNLYNTRQLRADRSWSRVFTASWFGRLRSDAALALKGEAHLSWQTDRAISGPLSPSGERDSRDPFGGFLVSPVGFRFDFDNFPVNDALIRNFRTNTGRRSPYDLNNTSQYVLIDQYRNNAYGLTGFSEGGGPVGLLGLYRENRLVGKAVVEGRVHDRHRVRLGLEWTRHDVDLYESGLTSQLVANAYVESPTRAAVFADYALALGPLGVSAGIRYDRFNTGASRPEYPRISSMPGFDPANPTAGFVKDRSHARVSPGIGASYRATPRLQVHAGLTARAQAPDFAASLAGINIDRGITSTRYVFGSDLDYEHATAFELGADLSLRPGLTLDVNVWHRQDDDLIQPRLVREFDPLISFEVDIVRLQNAGTLKTTGLDLRLSQRLGAQGQAWVSYTYADPSQEQSGSSPFGSTVDVPVAEARPHTLAGALLYQTGPGSALLGGVLRDLGVYATARLASGTAYTRCPASVPENDDVLSGELCATFFEGEFNGSRLPMLKLVDLRLTRELRIGATRLMVFADVRNLLNSRNLTRVFTQTGTTSNAAARAKIRQVNLDELAFEAQANGVRLADGSVDLSFGGAADPRAACGSWMNAGGTPTVPNCIYLIEAERRWGDGDHIFTAAEQTRASDALYQVARGLQHFTGPGRRVRLGLELRL